ncbi:MAG: agmatine deiminase family protein [Thermoplasmatota archaeon]
MSVRLPAEWEPQQSVWFVWPRDPQTWPGEHLERARAAYRQAIEAVAAHQRVDLIVHPELEVPVGLPAAVRVHRVAHQDSWIRDYGPLTVEAGGTPVGLKFRFDAWGGKYDSLLADDGVAARLDWPAPLAPVDAVLEGGAVETDGRGTFLATESVARGRGQSVAEHEAILRDHLGARKVIWLGDGIQGDDTDGHIDTITRFVAPGKVVTAVAPDGHPDHDALADNLERLRGATDADGHPLEVLELPCPEPLSTEAGDPLPAGHANFLVTDRVVLVPTYGGASDQAAMDLLGSCFPDRRVVGIDHRDLIWGFGGIHCLSMQVARPPAG